VKLGAPRIIDDLCVVGFDVGGTPQPFLNYLENYNELLPDIPLRLRIGGNSVDSSIFDESQTQFSIPSDSSTNADDQPVSYGPLVFKVMDAVAERLGGVDYLFGEFIIPSSN
jgi:hypothetical protein